MGTVHPNPEVRMRHRHLIPAIALMLGLAAAAAQGQDAPIKRLGAPTATHPAEFTRIRGVRELEDGRVFLVDAHELRVVRIDFATGKLTTMGRTGRGPGEYQAPIGLLALPADSAVVIDMSGGPANVLLTREGVSNHGVQVERATRGGSVLNRASKTDALGRIYFHQRIIQTLNGKPVAADSDAIIRVDRGSNRRDTIAYVSRTTRSPLIKEKREERVVGGMVMSRPSRTPIPFTSVDQFAVAPDGRVAVVSVEPYHVTFFGPDGARTTGPTIAFTPVRVDDDVKEAYRENAMRPRLSLMFARGGAITPSVGPPSEYTAPEEWPDALPAFLGDAVWFAPDGNLWVERATHPDAATTFDVIDRAGRVAMRVELPADRHLAGFGDGTVYLVRVDEVDLEYLERYALPK